GVGPRNLTDDIRNVSYSGISQLLLPGGISLAARSGWIAAGSGEQSRVGGRVMRRPIYPAAYAARLAQPGSARQTLLGSPNLARLAKRGSARKKVRLAKPGSARQTWLGSQKGPARRKRRPNMNLARWTGLFGGRRRTIKVG